MRISYGKFDFYSGGAIPGVHRDGAPLWHDMETPVAQVVGPVEVSVLNHHGNRVTMCWTGCTQNESIPANRGTSWCASTRVAIPSA